MVQGGIPFALALQGLGEITAKLARLVIWLTFVTVHLVAALLVLWALWWFQVSPQGIRTWVAQGFRPGAIGTTIVGIAALLGISVGAALWAYAKAWRWMLRKFLRPSLGL